LTSHTVRDSRVLVDDDPVEHDVPADAQRDAARDFFLVKIRAEQNRSASAFRRRCVRIPTTESWISPFQVAAFRNDRGRRGVMRVPGRNLGACRSASGMKEIKRRVAPRELIFAS
jgi:hypothetical protein